MADLTMPVEMARQTDIMVLERGQAIKVCWLRMGANVTVSINRATAISYPPVYTSPFNLNDSFFSSTFKAVRSHRKRRRPNHRLLSSNP